MGAAQLRQEGYERLDPPLETFGLGSGLYLWAQQASAVFLEMPAEEEQVAATVAASTSAPNAVAASPAPSAEAAASPPAPAPLPAPHGPGETEAPVRAISMPGAGLGSPPRPRPALPALPAAATQAAEAAEAAGTAARSLEAVPTPLHSPMLRRLVEHLELDRYSMRQFHRLFVASGLHASRRRRARRAAAAQRHIREEMELRQQEEVRGLMPLCLHIAMLTPMLLTPFLYPPLCRSWRPACVVVGG